MADPTKSTASQLASLVLVTLTTFQAGCVSDEPVPPSVNDPQVPPACPTDIVTTAAQRFGAVTVVEPVGFGRDATETLSGIFRDRLANFVVSVTRRGGTILELGSATYETSVGYRFSGDAVATLFTSTPEGFVAAVPELYIDLGAAVAPMRLVDAEVRAVAGANGASIAAFEVRGVLTPAAAQDVYLEIISWTLYELIVNSGGDPLDVDTDGDAVPDAWRTTLVFTAPQRIPLVVD